MDILVADDDTTSRQILAAVLRKWGYTVRLAKDGTEAWEQLQDLKAPRLAVLDWMMPGMDGVEICRRLRSEQPSRAHYTYVLLLTAKGAKGDVVEGMEAGADDYLVKPFDPQELRVRLRAGQRIIELQEQLQSAQEELRRQSMTDPLTGILNRRAVLDRLETEMARASREGRPLGLVALDIDHFKAVNDTWGHLTGDEVLREVACRARAALRAYDVFGRVGGEEFLVVLPGTDIASAAKVSERLRQSLCAQPVPSAKGPINVTASLGATVWVYGEGVDPLLDRADRALYLAKEKGRNRVEVLDPTDKEALSSLCGPSLGRVMVGR